MSGGSYNYLYRWELEYPPCLEDMAKALDMRGMSRAARATREQAAFEPAQELRDLWHAVEWSDSGDSAEDDVARAFVAWENACDQNPPILNMIGDVEMVEGKVIIRARDPYDNSRAILELCPAQADKLKSLLTRVGGDNE